jgi:hypothetical protein
MLVVLHDAVIMKLQLTGSAGTSNPLSISELLARSALGRF